MYQSPSQLQAEPLGERTVLSALDYKCSLAAAEARDRGLITYQSGDTDIGYTLCLYHAAATSDTNPPSVELPNRDRITLRLHSGTCPPRFLDFFRRWAHLVPDIKNLNYAQKNQLEAMICNPALVDPYSVPPSTPPMIRQIAQCLIVLARDIQSCRTSSFRQNHRDNISNPPPINPQRSPWLTATYTLQETTYAAPSGIHPSPMYHNQNGFMFPEHQSTSPIDFRPNDSFIGGFRRPVSPGGFIPPTPRNTAVDMPTACPFTTPDLPQANHSFLAPVAPLSLKRRSLSSRGRISPVQAQRAFPDPSSSTWQPGDTIVPTNHGLTSLHRTTLSNETNESVETTSSERTNGSCETRSSVSSVEATISTQLDRSTDLPRIVTSLGALSLPKDEVFAPETASTDSAPNQTPTGAIPLENVVAPITAVKNISTTSQLSTPADAITRAATIVSSCTSTAALSSKTKTTPIGAHTPASEIIIQLCGDGCSNLTSELDASSISVRPVGNGGFGQVYRARLNDGTDIALKILGIHGKNEDKHLKHAAHELHAWSKCSHPNIAPLLGLAEFDNRIGMVSPWMENGDLSQYLREKINVNKLDLCSQIASAMAYLHSINIVHGDLKGPNVLVSNDGIPVLIDFGNAILSEYTLQFTQTTTKHDMSLRWTAPELMNDEKPSYKSDVYALGMTILEIFTGKTPYHGMRDPAVVFNVGTWKTVPDRPTDCIPLDESWANRLWDLLMSCWDHVPDYRPTAREVCGHLRKINDTLGSAK